MRVLSALFLGLILMTSGAYAAPAEMNSQSVAPLAAQQDDSSGSYYDWGRGRDGYGYCYEWTNDGYVLNGGAAVGNYNCEQVNPSRFNWHRSVSGWGNCYQFTAYGVAMNRGQAQGYYNCEKDSPSYFRWGRGNNGYTYCYQYGDGYVLNEGRAVPNYNCQ